MRGQLSVQTVLIFLLGITAAGSLLYFFVNLSADTLAESEKIRSYPEIEPQILSLNCFTNYGYAAVTSDKLEGTILYEVKNSTNIVKRGELTTNITDFGTLYFSGLMNRGITHTVRFFTPKWSVTETCTANLDSDVVLYMPFDANSGTTAKDWANGNDGTLNGIIDGVVNGATWTTGYLSGALSFNGSTDYVNLSQPDELKITDEVTLSAWINTNDDGGSHTVVSRGYAYMINAPYSNSLEFYGHDGSNFTICTYPWTYDNQWIHVAVSIRNYTGSWTLKGFVNGTEVCSNTNVNFKGPRDIGETVNIGRLSAGAGSRYFNGSIDDVKIYNRALNGTKVSQLHNGQDVRDGLVGYWALDENSGTSARDTHMWAGGKRGRALYTDGVNDYVLVIDSDSLDISTPWTVSFWTKKFGNSFGLISKDGVGLDTTGAYNFYFRDELYFQYDVNNIGALQTATGESELDKWYFVTFTFDNSTNPKAKIYINGKENKTGNPAAPYILDENLLMGRRGIGSYFNGLLDEVYIYDSVLTSEEIKAIYDGYFS